MRHLVLVLVFASVVVAACGDEAATDPCGEPLYGGFATDEAWRVILDAYDAAEVGAADAATVTSPAAAAVIPAAGPAPTLSWTSPIAALPPEERALAPRFAAPAPRPEAGSLWDDVAGFFVGTARAHLPPITSDVYYVEIATAGVACPWRVLTTSESWVPDDATWAELAARPGAYTLTITSAYLVQNRITEGPFRPAAATAFEIR